MVFARLNWKVLMKREYRRGPMPTRSTRKRAGKT
jgi:hypothetical protein